MHYENLLGKYPIISDQIKRPALSVVLRELEKTLLDDVAGAVVELGCYIGTTSLFVRRVLDRYQTDKLFHVYDSFQGLPIKTTQDQSAAGIDFKAGELTVSKRQLLDEFTKAKLKPPIIHKAWFDDLTASELPESISFAFLDGDFYSSIMTSLRLVWPRLSKGGTIAIDDYQRETLPGVEAAVRNFFQHKAIHLHHEHNIAIIRAT